MSQPRARHRQNGALTLVPCPSCGKQHYAGSERSRLCRSGGIWGTAGGPVPGNSFAGGPAFLLDGELFRTGEGDTVEGLPMPHAVFSAQMLPRGIEAEPQPRHEKIPSTQEESKRLIAKMRAAARSAVHEWRRRGIEPTQRMMFDMDVYLDEVHDLQQIHAQAVEESAKKLRERIPSALSAPHPTRDRQQAFHAIRTVKGLAVSPVNLQRVLARSAPGQVYEARDFISFAIGLRAVADTKDGAQVRDFLSLSSEDVTDEQIRPIVTMVRNVAAHHAGRVRLDDQGRALSEVTRHSIANFGPDTLEATQEGLRAVEAEAKSRGAEDVALSIYDDHADLLALPPSVAGDLLAAGLTYQQWRDYGWEGPGVTRDFQRVLLEPELVKMRMGGMTDEIIVTLRPQVDDRSNDYEYAPGKFLDGAGYYAVAGYSAVGARNFGTDDVNAMAERVRSLHVENNVHEGVPEAR